MYAPRRRVELVDLATAQVGVVGVGALDDRVEVAAVRRSRRAPRSRGWRARAASRRPAGTGSAATWRPVSEYGFSRSVPSASKCSRNGPNSSPTQNVPSFARTTDSMSKSAPVSRRSDVASFDDREVEHAVAVVVRDEALDGDRAVAAVGGLPGGAHEVVAQQEVGGVAPSCRTRCRAGPRTCRRRCRSRPRSRGSPGRPTGPVRPFADEASAPDAGPASRWSADRVARATSVGSNVWTKGECELPSELPLPAAMAGAGTRTAAVAAAATVRARMRGSRAAHEDSAHAREPIDADRRDDVRTWNRSGRPGEHLPPHASRASCDGNPAVDWDKRPTLATLLHVMARTRRGVLAGVALTVLVALGAGVAVVLGDELGIRSEPADIPSETLVAAPETPTIAPPEFTQVDRPGIRSPGPRRLASCATPSPTPPRPTARPPSRSSSATVPDADETYRVEGSPDALTIVAASEAGAVRGVYDLAAAVRDGRTVTEHLGETVDSRLGRSAWSTSAPSASRSTSPPGRTARLLAQLQGVRRRHPRRRAVHRRGGARGRARRLRALRAPRARRGLQRDRDPGLHRVPDVLRARRRRRRVRPDDTTWRGPSRCARRSGRCGSTPTTSASRSTSAPTCSR